MSSPIRRDYRGKKTCSAKPCLSDIKALIKSLEIPFNDPDDPDYTGDCNICIDVDTFMTIDSVAITATDNPDELSFTVNWIDAAGAPQSTTSNVVMTLDNQELVDNGDGTINITGSAGAAVDVCKLLADGACELYTLEDADGNSFPVSVGDTTAIISSDDSVNIDLSTPGTIDITSTPSVVTPVVADGNVIATHDDGLGNSVDIMESITPLVTNDDGSFTYTDQTGAETVIPAPVDNGNLTGAAVENADGSTTITLTHTNSDGTTQDFPFDIPAPSTVTQIVTAGNTVATHTDGSGTDVDIIESITPLVDNGDGTYTYIDESGTAVTFDTNDTVSPLVNNGDGTATYTDEAGVATVLDICAMVDAGGCKPTIVANGDGTYTFNDGFGNTSVIDVNEIDMDIQSFVVSGSNVTFTSEDGSTASLDVCAIVAGNCNSTLVANADGSLTHTANDGTVTVVPPSTSNTYTLDKTADTVNCKTDFDLKEDGNSIQTFSVPDVNTNTGTQSLTANDTGSYTNHIIGGENDDNGVVDVETDDIAQKVFVAETITDCSRTSEITVEKWHTQTYVDWRFGNDATALVLRDDKPFKTYGAAHTAMRAAGYFTEDYSIIVRAGQYDIAGSTRADNGEYVTIIADGKVHFNFTSGAGFFAEDNSTMHIYGRPDITNIGGSVIRVRRNSEMYAEVGKLVTESVFATFMDVDSYMELNFETSIGGHWAQSGSQGHYKGSYCENTEANTQANFYANGGTQYIDVDRIYNGNITVGTISQTNQSCIGSQGNGISYVRCFEAISENSATVSVNSAAASTGAFATQVHLQSGRYISRSATKPVIQLQPDQAITGDELGVFIHSASVLIEEGGYGFSIDRVAGGGSGQIHLYSVVSMTMPLGVNTNLLTGTADVNANVK